MFGHFDIQKDNFIKLRLNRDMDDIFIKLRFLQKLTYVKIKILKVYSINT